MTRRIAPFLALAALAATPAPVAAQDPAPAPGPDPPAATMRLELRRVSAGRVLAGERWVVRGTMRPYVTGQKASLRFYRRGKKILVKGVSVRPVSGAGRFELGFRASQPGRITVRGSHRATAELGTAVAKPVRVEVLALRAAPGARGRVVRVLQARLAKLGYVVGRRGLYDDRTARAVQAFRKLTGMARTFVASTEVFRRLARGQGAFKVRYPRHGRHVEADLTHQVLALVGSRGRVERVYPMSSGKPSTPTIVGSFRVYSKTPGTNAKGMIHSNYFIRGYAIHGYVDVPIYPASHGCLRIPPQDAVPVYQWIRYGTPVDTYYR